jgi:hypothetical protein
MGDVIGPGDLCSRAATLKGYFYTNLVGTLLMADRYPQEDEILAPGAVFTHPGCSTLFKSRRR